MAQILSFIEKNAIMKKWIPLFVLVVVLASCSKYEEGPNVSLKTKKERITNKWKLRSAWVNGHYALDQVYDHIYEITKEGNITLINFDQQIHHGSWEFTDEKQNLLLRLYFRETDEVIETKEWEILRLKSEELWIRTLHEGIEYEYHFDVM